MASRAAQVVAFEPDPYAREMLARNAALNSKHGTITIEALACSDRDGEAVLFSRGGQANSSFARSAVEKQSLALEEIRVPTITLDRYLAEHSLSPRIVKIDAEGAEIRILKGARSLLASDAKILCELHPYAWAEFGNSLSELESLIAVAGRKMRYLDPMRKPNTYGMTVFEY
jgi:FkbM family methyltransferase